MTNFLFKMFVRMCTNYPFLFPKVKVRNLNVGNSRDSDILKIKHTLSIFPSLIISYYLAIMQHHFHNFWNVWTFCILWTIDSLKYTKIWNTTKKIFSLGSNILWSPIYLNNLYNKHSSSIFQGWVCKKLGHIRASKQKTFCV